MPIVLNPGTFDALIFDCDGTLVDTAPAHYSAIRHALQRIGRDMASHWYFERVGLAPDALLDAYEADDGKLPVSRTELLKPYAVAFQRSSNQLQEVTIVADVARAWKGRVPMAVASNGQRGNVQSSLESVGLMGLFDHLITVEDVRQGKPAPDIFLEAAVRMGARPGRCIVLEDSEEGLAAAKAARMQWIDIRESWSPDWKNPAGARTTPQK